MVLELGRGAWSPAWPLGVDPSRLWPQAPCPGFVKMGWRLHSAEGQGTPIKEG